MITRKNKSKNLVQLRDDVVVGSDKIDIILKTNKNPKDNTTLSEDIYVVYLNKDSKYSYIIITEEDFKKYIKQNL